MDAGRSSTGAPFLPGSSRPATAPDDNREILSDSSADTFR